MTKQTVESMSYYATARPFQMAVYPRSNNNPYLDLFYRAMAAHGLQVRAYLDLTSNGLPDIDRGVDALHVHWNTSRIWRKYKPRFRGYGRLHKLAKKIGSRSSNDRKRLITAPLSELLGIRMLGRFLERLRVRGVRVIWTLHDLEPPEAVAGIDRHGQRMLARHSDLIIVHTEGARAEALRRYRPKCEVVVMPHGNYDGVYPEPRPREEVFAELRLDPSRPVVSCLGRIREYKGLDIACEAVRRCKGVQLLIAGTVQPGFDIAGLRRRVHASDGIRLEERYVTDQEFSDYAAASDAILLPYRKITGSGALLAAWTLSRGVVASDLEFFREMVPADSNAGVLFPREDAQGLAETIQQYLAVPAQVRCDAARGMADRYGWDRCVEPVVAVLRHWYTQGVSPCLAQDLIGHSSR